MSKPHKHAALMAEYAKDAAETETPWERWEFRYPKFESNVFKPAHGTPRWSPFLEYQRKPQTININGHEVPAPYRGPMQEGEDFFYPDFENIIPVTFGAWKDTIGCHNLRSRGFIHLTLEAASEHAKALMSVNRTAVYQNAKTNGHRS